MTTRSFRTIRPALAAAALGLLLLSVAPLAAALETTAPAPSPQQSNQSSQSNKGSPFRGDARGQDGINQEREDRRSQKERRDRRNRGAATKVEPHYPEATREEPETKASRKGMKRLQDLVELYNAGDDAATLAAALEIANDEDSNAYEKAFSFQIAGTAASGAGDDKAAETYFAKSIEADGLGNNDHYAAMLNLAVMQYTLEQYDQALQTIDRFLAETKSGKPEALNLRGASLMGLERYAEAAEIYEAQLQANPEDKTARMNAVAAYQQANREDKAVELLAAAHAKGQFTDANEYRALYVSYLNAERDKDALAVIEDGLAKGVLANNPELARAFMVIAQNAYYAGDEATAIAMYERAAPISDKGEAALNLAKLHADNGNQAKAREAAELALSKGVKDEAQAKRIAGRK